MKAPPMTPNPDADGKSGSVDPRLQAHIGRRLRLLYDQMVSEPVPDRFKALLDELENRDPSPVATAEAPK